MTRRGFTLIELLIVLAILATMMAIIVPSFTMVPSAQISMAAKDSLRLMRYARNMALQTQQPITLDFVDGTIQLSTAHDTAIASTNATTSVTVLGHDNESLSITKKYSEIEFHFLDYTDTIDSVKSKSKVASFNTYTSSEKTTPKQKTESESDDKSKAFSITIRTNGTTRPFKMRICERGETNETAGDILTFDFLCSGSIGND